MQEAELADDLFTLAEICERFKGKIGKTKLVAHLRFMPFFGGGPTHRKIGAKYLFTEADVSRFVDSLACPTVALSDGPPTPSEDKVFRRAMARLTLSQAMPLRSPEKRGK
jgi:hypothetical protein